MTLKFFPILIIVISILFLGCIQEKSKDTPVPTPAETAVTMKPTAAPTAQAPSPTPTPTPVPTPKRPQALYISDVDEFGFSKLTIINATGSYKNHTINLNQGDTVKWVSVTNAGFYLTIVSKEGLWNNSSSFLRYRFRAFNYTFNTPGEYEVYLKEFPRDDHQKIIVSP